MAKLSIARNPYQTGYHQETSFQVLSCQFNTLHQFTQEYRYSSAIFVGGRRKKSNVTGFVNLIIYDIDNDDDILTMEDAIRQLSFLKNLIVSTKSHQIEKNGTIADRFRIILPLPHELNCGVEEYPFIYLYIAERLNILSFIDQACKDVARMYMPCKSQEVHYSQAINMMDISVLMKEFHIDRALINKRELEAKKQSVKGVSNKNVKFNEMSKSEYVRSILGTVRFLEMLKVDERFYVGGRNRALYSIGRYLQDVGLASEEIKNALFYVNNCREDGLDMKEIECTIFRSLKL